MTTGTFRHPRYDRTTARNSIPLISGIIASSTITSGTVVATAIKASRPLRAEWTECPIRRRYRSTASRLSPSSSTTNTFAERPAPPCPQF